MTSNNYYFEILYKRYSSKVFGKCLTLLRDDFKAQDATQDIMMKILLNLSKFGGKSKFSTWIYSITYNFCIDQIRKSKKDKSDLVENLNELADIEDEVSDKLLLEVKLDQLKVICDELPIADKSILMMKYMDNMSIKDISEIIDKTESAVKMKIKRAKEKFIRRHNSIAVNSY